MWTNALLISRPCMPIPPSQVWHICIASSSKKNTDIFFRNWVTLEGNSNVSLFLKENPMQIAEYFFVFWFKVERHVRGRMAVAKQQSSRLWIKLIIRNKSKYILSLFNLESMEMEENFWSIFPNGEFEFPIKLRLGEWTHLTCLLHDWRTELSFLERIWFDELISVFCEIICEEICRKIQFMEPFV